MDILPVQDAVSLVILFLLSLEDISRKHISSLLVISYMAAGFIFSLVTCENSGIMYSFIPGIIMFLCSIAFEEDIGPGDGLVLMGLGLWTGTIRCLISVIASFFLLSVFSL
ncbi:MAG: prepilin peptidase, partial [Firmicutes bacterium]|nr:prepilin peptidase [Bacillota bacterium]